MKIRNKLRLLLLSIGLLMSTFVPIRADFVPLNAQDDIDTIKQRLKDSFVELESIDDGAKVETIRVSEANDHLNTMNADGSWSDVDYEARDNAANGRPWSPYLALDRMQAIAIAYEVEGNALYHDQRAIDALDKALLHWKSVKPSSTNWWENDIGVNLRFSRIGLFLENHLSSESFEVILNSLNKEGKYQGTGQNNLWYDQNALYRALITNDADQLKKVIEECLEYVLILQTDNITQEALQVDNSLYFHGVQFYSNGYGLSMFRDMSFWLFMLRDTQFALNDEVKNRMSDYMLDGTRWTIRGDIAELYLGYRPYKSDVGYDNYAKEYIVPLERMKVVDAARASEYQVLIDNINGDRDDNGADGNNYMWRVGYGSHMRNDYGINIKMDSKRIIGGEWRGSWPSGKDSGNLIYWTASGSSTIMVDGDEYNSVYPTYDWAHSPGVTSPNYVPKDYSNYGRVTNGNDHTIGVSDGTYGSTSYIMNKANTQAHKSYFFFDEGFVALGAGITSTNGSPIHTTINQAKANNVLVDGVAVPSESRDVETNASWIHNDNTGYVFFEDTQVVVNNGYQNETPSLWDDALKVDVAPTFSTWINHGVKPTNASYAYAVFPNNTSTQTQGYATNNPFEVIANTADVQAVRHSASKITQINFYKAGSLEYKPGHTISVDKAVNIILDESTATPQISIAMTDTSYGESVNVVIDDVETHFILKGAPYTGSTLTQAIGTSNLTTSSTHVENHGPEKAFDDDLSTYWKSEVGENQWIQSSLQGSKYVSSVSINWNENNYAKHFILQGSVNGETFFDLKEIVDGDGSESVISLNHNLSDIRIKLIESSENQGYEITEIQTETSENISKDSVISVSSVSATDTKNVAQLAIDGDKSTRWSSARNSNAEWVILDFEGIAEISAINIQWESARSGQYTLETSNDKLNWTHVKTVTEIQALEDSFTFESGVKGRYLRLNSTQSVQSKYGISIFELEVYGSVDRSGIVDKPNLALNKPSESSSAYTNPYTGFTLESKYAFDGSIVNNGDSFQSRWVSARESNDEWILVDLEHVYAVDKIVLNWEGAYAKEYKLMGSLDKETWFELEHIEDGISGIVAHELDTPINARYVKMQGVVPATKYGYSLWEFEVYGEPAERENVALNKETNASSVYMNPKSGFALESKYAVDGSVVNNGDAFQSRWVSARESNNEWIEIDLDGLYLIDDIVLNWEGAFGKEYKLQVSNDGVTWKDVYHVEDGRAGNRSHEMDDNLTAQYVRMQGIIPATKYGYSLWEFEVYGYKISDKFIDKTVLEEVLREVLAIDQSHYTKKSVETLNEAITQANTALSDEVSQDVVNASYDALNAAREGLILRESLALEEAIEEAKAIDGSLYTHDSYQNLVDVITEAEALVLDGAYENQDYADMVVTLGNAIDALIEKDIVEDETAQDIADKITTLTISDNALSIPSFDGFTLTIHSSSEPSVIALDGTVVPQSTSTSVSVVIMVSNDNDNTDTAFTASIPVIVEPLIEDVDDTTLVNLMDYVSALVAEDYSVSSYHKLNALVEEASELLNDDNHTQDDIDAMVSEINSALDQLITVKELRRSVVSAQALDLNKYTASTRLTLNNALDAALQILQQADAPVSDEARLARSAELNQAIVDNANDALLKALKELELKAYDYNAMNALIETIESLDQSTVTKESYAELLSLLNDIKLQIASDDLTQDELNVLFEALSVQFKSLETVDKGPKDPVTPNPDEGTTPKDDNAVLPSTGVSSVYPFGYTLIGVGTVLSFIRRKKK